VSVTIAPDSYMTVERQAALYLENRGLSAYERQHLLARAHRGLCICKTRRLVRKDFGPFRRTYHEQICPRYEEWMAAA